MFALLTSPRVEEADEGEDDDAEGELYLKRIAAQIIIESICDTKTGYPEKLAMVRSSRGWSDGPFWHLIPSHYSDILLDYCLKGGNQVELLISGAASLVFRNARPEQAEALMRKVLRLGDPAKAEEESGKEEREEDREKEEEKKSKKKKRKLKAREVFELSETFVPRIIKIPAIKGRLKALLEELKKPVLL